MLKAVVRNVPHGFGYFCRIDLILYCAARPSDALGVGLDVHTAAQRVAPALSGYEFGIDRSRAWR
jgi:hypothetical protein